MRITAGPYLQNVARDAITIMWQTDEPATSAVEYERSARLGWSAYAGRPEPTYPCRTENRELRTIHAVRLTGLETEQVYYYRVSSSSSDGESAISAGASFRTAVHDNSPFSFATYGDSLRVQDEHRRNAELARAYRADICVGAGDHAQDEIARFEDFFASTAGLLPYTPWFAAMGNHDSPNEGYFRYFNFPEPHYWYSFNYGAAHFTVLNSNMDYRPGSEQWLWLEHDLKTFRKRALEVRLLPSSAVLLEQLRDSGDARALPVVRAVWRRHRVHRSRHHLRAISPAAGRAIRQR